MPWRPRQLARRLLAAPAPAGPLPRSGARRSLLTLGASAGLLTTAGATAGGHAAASAGLYAPDYPGAVPRPVAERLTDLVSVKDFGARGDGTGDDTAAFEAALATRRSVWVPAGRYRITRTLPVGVAGALSGQQMTGAGTGATVLLVGADIVAIAVLASYSGVRDLALDGSVAGETVGGVGITAGFVNKVVLENVATRFFRFAGVALNGTQNSMLVNCESRFALYNFYVGGRSRNCILFNCNASDWPDPGAPWVTPAMRAASPDARAIFVGLKANPYLPQGAEAWPAADYGRIPSNISVFKGIYERYDRHDYVAEVAQCYGRIVLFDVELTRARASLIRLPEDKGTSGENRLQLFLHHCNFIKARGVASVIDNPHGVPVLASPDAISVPASEAARFTTTDDYAAFAHALAAPPSFAHGIGGWRTSGAAGVAVGWREAARRLVVEATESDGAMCEGRHPYKAAAVDGATLYKIKGICTALSGPTDICAGLAGPPWHRPAHRVERPGEFEALYACQGDEAPAALKIKAAPGSGRTRSEWAYLSVTIL